MEIKDIFDVNSLIRWEAIKGILDDNLDKKVYCFGGGTAAEILMSELLYKYNIEGFLDNNAAIWGKRIGGKTVCDPKILLEQEKGTFIVLILSRHYVVISKQLEEYHLIDKQDYFDIFSEFEKYFQVKRFALSAEKFMNFIENIPNDIFNSAKEVKQKHIGIVCIATMVESQAWYPIAIFLLLKYLGYNATLIVDEMSSCDDIVYYDGYTRIAKLYIDYIIEKMRDRLGDLDICYVDAEGIADLDENDEKEISRLTEVAVKWQMSRPSEVMEETYTRKAFKEIIARTMSIVKAFFDKHHFDAINVISAAHKHRGVYTWEGKRYGIPVSSYDGNSAEGYTIFSADGPCSHGYDIVRVIKDGMLDRELINYIVENSKKNFEKRINSTKEIGGYNFQPIVKLEKNQQFYDIIMPLNINCDMAALGIDRVFQSEQEWIFETVDFILNSTDASVMVREHPAMIDPGWGGWRIHSYREEFEQRYKNSSRVTFCRADQEINTYRMIEKAKLVLPYSSTVGVEAFLLGKPVITHTNVYYSELNFVFNAHSPREYFQYIIDGINNKLENKKEIEEAYITYYGVMHALTKSCFTERKESWMELQIPQLLKEEGVQDIINVIAENVPPIYMNVKRNYEHMEV